ASPPLSHTLALHDALPISSRRRIGRPTYECSGSEPWLLSLTSPCGVPVVPALPNVIGAAQRQGLDGGARVDPGAGRHAAAVGDEDRKSTRLNSSHGSISYA